MNKVCCFLLFFCGIVVLAIWGVWFIIGVEIESYPVQTAMCETETHLYPPYAIRAYSLKYQRDRTWVCTENVNESCNIDYFDGRMVECFLYYSDADNTWVSVLDKTQYVCSKSNLCDLYSKIRDNGIIYSIIYISIVIIVVVGTYFLERKAVKLPVIVEREEI